MTLPMRRMVLVLAAALVVFGLGPRAYERIYDDRKLPALSRYALERTPDYAIVGSSMTTRLYEPFFGVPIRNLGLSGGSSLTGLSVISAYQALPRVILVETNIMVWPTDAALVARYGPSDRPFRVLLTPMRWAVSNVYYWLKFNAHADEIRDLPNLPPTDHDNAKSVDEALAIYKAAIFKEDVQQNTLELKRIITNLESRGSTVFLFEMPLPDPVEKSEFFEFNRDTVRQAFPDKERWIDLSGLKPELRWEDSAHMDVRSSILVARELGKFLASLPKPTMQKF